MRDADALCDTHIYMVMAEATDRVESYQEVILNIYNEFYDDQRAKVYPRYRPLYMLPSIESSGF
jgi:hypothetical protein